MPCSEKRARIMLGRGRARIHRMMPFTIRLVDRLQENSVLQPLRLKLDPGSKTTGLALVREAEHVEPDTGEVIKAITVLTLLELNHRGHAIRDALTSRRAFRRRRRGNLRYRPARFDNRTRPKAWLPPSLRHRVDTVMAWVTRLSHLAPITSLSQELARFDTQAMQNPEISGVEYQQGTLAGYEAREYLLEKWGRKCAYCGKGNVPLEIDHIHPRSLDTLAMKQTINSPLFSSFQNSFALRLKHYRLHPTPFAARFLRVRPPRAKGQKRGQ